MYQLSSCNLPALSSSVNVRLQLVEISSCVGSFPSSCPPGSGVHSAPCPGARASHLCTMASLTLAEPSSSGFFRVPTASEWLVPPALGFPGTRLASGCLRRVFDPGLGLRAWRTEGGVVCPRSPPAESWWVSWAGWPWTRASLLAAPPAPVVQGWSQESQL